MVSTTSRNLLGTSPAVSPIGYQSFRGGIDFSSLSSGDRSDSSDGLGMSRASSFATTQPRSLSMLSPLSEDIPPENRENSHHPSSHQSVPIDLKPTTFPSRAAYFFPSNEGLMSPISTLPMTESSDNAYSVGETARDLCMAWSPANHSASRNANQINRNNSDHKRKVVSSSVSQSIANSSTVSNSLFTYRTRTNLIHLQSRASPGLIKTETT
jgi:hypothetical protein